MNPSGSEPPTQELPAHDVDDATDDQIGLSEGTAVIRAAAVDAPLRNLNRTDAAFG
jgi:hypothetical protein